LLKALTHPFLGFVLNPKYRWSRDVSLKPLTHLCFGSPNIVEPKCKKTALKVFHKRNPKTRVFHRIIHFLGQFSTISTSFPQVDISFPQKTNLLLFFFTRKNSFKRLTA